MKAWLESLVGPEYATALLWTIVALIVLLVLLIAIRIVRAFSVGTFISGGRHRKTRLAVMDATAVDSHRRLVLVRRDDVEHLILIGGPSDVVVEQNIRMASPTRRPALEDGHAHRAAAEAAYAPEPAHAPAQAPVHEHPPIRPAPAPARPVAPPAPRPPAPVAAPVPPPAHSPALSPAPSPARQEPRFPQPTAQPARPAPAPMVQPMRPVVTPPSVGAERAGRTDLDDALLRELEVSLDKELPAAPKPAAPAPTPAAMEDTLDAEMSKLLRELAGNKQ